MWIRCQRAEMLVRLQRRERVLASTSRRLGDPSTAIITSHYSFKYNVQHRETATPTPMPPHPLPAMTQGTFIRIIDVALIHTEKVVRLLK